MNPYRHPGPSSRAAAAAPLRRRRQILLGLGATALLGASGAWHLPRALAALAPQSAGADAADFIALSTWLTGRTALNKELGQRYFAALSARYPAFRTQLAGLIARRAALTNPEPQAFCDAVDASGEAYATLPRQIIAAWYVGLVGDLPRPDAAQDRSTPPQLVKASVLAYEMALMYEPVRDVLAIPSYCRDVPGYWAQPPQANPAAGAA